MDDNDCSKQRVIEDASERSQMAIESRRKETTARIGVVK